MKHWVRWVVFIAVFAVAFGHLAYHSFGPSPQPEYFVGGDVTAFAPARADAKNLYLRREFFLTQVPRHAWLEAVSQDELTLYINGRKVLKNGGRSLQVGHAMDLTQHLQVGTNTIALLCSENAVDRAPRVWINVGYRLDDGVHELAVDDQWRAAEVFERGALWWFENNFDDSGWAHASTEPYRLRAMVPGPYRALVSSSDAKWMTPVKLGNTTTIVRREFEIDGRPQSAWLSLAVSASYRLAVNGTVISTEEFRLGTSEPVEPALRTYDLTPYLADGTNTLSLLMVNPVDAPHFLADLEVTDGQGKVTRFDSDELWVSSPLPAEDWVAHSQSNQVQWESCAAEVGDLGLPRWALKRELVELQMPESMALARKVAEVGVMLLAAGAAALACFIAATLLRPNQGERLVKQSAVGLALILPAILIGIAVLAQYDPRIAVQDIYQPKWLWMAAALVPLQWGLVAMLAGFSRTGARVPALPKAPVRVTAAGLAVAALVLVGFFLRVRDVGVESLHPDEVSCYRAAEGVWDVGFPSAEIAGKRHYAATSELVPMSIAAAEIFFDNPRYVVRMPAVIYGTLTILLLYIAGRNMFAVSVGLLAAAIYTFAPTAIGTNNFGRYFSQLQFFTLATVYFYYRTIAPPGGLDRRALWLTVVTFIAAFLSWEGVALIAIGMMLAGAVERRGRLKTIFLDPHVWVGMAVIGVVVVLQHAHRSLQQTSMLWIGTGAQDVSLKDMWRYPQFHPMFYVWFANWQRDMLLPLTTLAAAVLLTVKHPFSRPARTLALVFLTNAALFALLLPVMATRYCYHLVSFVILLDSAAVIAAARYLMQSASGLRMPVAWQRYAQGVAATAVVLYLVVTSGLTLRTDQLTDWVGPGYVFRGYKFAGEEAAVNYMLDRVQPGDVVLAVTPHMVNHVWAFRGGHEKNLPGKTSYWVESRLQLQPSLGAASSQALHRLSGTPMLSTLDDVKNVFAANQRIWYVVTPAFHGKLNETQVSHYMRENMDVVYEDFRTLVFYRDGNHRPASQQRRGEEALEFANTDVLP